ncbi:MAG: cyclic nucleotide-binding domain-containing protein [Gammaproteobacteria bacterium]|jgi:CRP-like cAMP-binding protein|nr:cyclic nucleotide-binding domain-containing protein [Gammaproteobacteria bacterium]
MDIPTGLFEYITEKLVPIKELSESSQKTLLETATVETIESGSFLFEQGDVDDNAHFLLVGKLEMMAMDETTFTIEAGSKQSFFPLGQMQPRQYSAKALGVVQVLKTSKSKLESLLDSEKNLPLSVSEENDDLDTGYNWMTHLLESKIFSSIPPENIQKIFALFEEVHFNKGESVIKQGEPGDYYYFIQAGKFDVLRHVSKQNKTFKLATLQEGDGFGEEALLGDTPRNASVIATTKGTLMRITKEAFLNLIRDPVINTVSYEQALQLKSDGAIWIDVRFPKEFKHCCAADSINMPLDMIRVQMNKLSPEKNYVVYCDNGARSAIAAYLLLNNGFVVSYLSEGIAEHLEKPVPQSNLADITPLIKEIKGDAQAALSSGSGNDDAKTDASALAYTEEIVQSLMSQETDMDELSKALSSVLASLFKQLEQALNDKAQAEIAKNIAEQKLEIMQKQSKLRAAS